MPRSWITSALVLLASGCASVVPTAPRFEVVGYYPSWKGRIEVDARRLTVVNYAFLVIGPQGGLEVDRPELEGPNFAYLASLKAANPRLKIVASVGGWTRSDRFSDMAADPLMRRRFIGTTLAFLRREGWDGIDIDWEYPTAIGVPCAPPAVCERPNDKRNFVALAREMRAVLDDAGWADGKRYLFTIASGMDRKWLFDEGSSRWMVELAKSLDWINLMTYDYHGTWEAAAGHVAPLLRDPEDPSSANADDSVTIFLEAGIPAKKLTLGMPFYAKAWEGCAPGPRGDALYQLCTGPLSTRAESSWTYDELAAEGYLAPGGAGFRRYWNDAARVPYLYNADTKVFIGYDDARSIAEKVRYARRRNLLGVMFWALPLSPDLARGLDDQP